MIKILHQLTLVFGVGLMLLAHSAPNQGGRYFEGELLIEESSNDKGCQRTVGKTKEVQISLQKTRNGQVPQISGWIVVAGGAPGRLEGVSLSRMSVTTNYYDAYLNTQMVLELNVTDGKASGILRETPARLTFGEGVCYWLLATLSLTEKTGSTSVSKKLREHAAWYRAYGHENRGAYHARYKQFEKAAADHELAIAEVDSVLPETSAYFKGLLNDTARLYAYAKDYERAAQRYQRFMKISVRQSEIGVDDPLFYSAWLRLASYMYLAKRTNDAIQLIERAAQLEEKAKDISLDDSLLRLSLQQNIYTKAQMFDQAKAVAQDAVARAVKEVGSDDPRTFEARAQLICLFWITSDFARFEADFESLTKEVVERFGEGHELARQNNQLLGMYYYQTDALAKARPWLERAFRGYRSQAESALEALGGSDEAKNIYAALLDSYIRLNMIPDNFLERVKAGEATLDDLPFHEAQIGKLN